MKELLEELQKRVQPASPFKWEVLPNKLVVGQCSIEPLIDGKFRVSWDGLTRESVIQLISRSARPEGSDRPIHISETVRYEWEWVPILKRLERKTPQDPWVEEEKK